MTSPRHETALRVALVLMGLITATPALAVVDPAALEAGYGVRDPEPMTQALLQHRGMMQLVLGAALVWAAFFPPARLAAAAGAITTKTTFLSFVLPDAALRSHVLPAIAFDSTCVVLLTALAVHEARTLRRRHTVRQRDAERSRS
jgi:hypothetical protein